MKTIRLEKPGKLVPTQLPEPGALFPGEALVRVRRIGVCGTDIHAFGGKQPFFEYPRILGHELGVEVVAVGRGVTNVRAGDRCAVEPYINCQKCIACRRGKPNCCTQLRVLGVHADGGMREQFQLPARKLHPSATLTLDQLALVETLAIGAHAVERAGIERGEYALVIGAGPIGLAVMQFALEKGAQVIVLDLNETRLDFCQRQLGVPLAINGRQDQAAEALRRVTADDGPTVVFDATGSPPSMRDAAHRVLGLYAALNVGLAFLVLAKLGWVSVAAVFLTYFFMSIMFPTIFALGISGLGERAKQASAFIVMAIMGGAVVPKLMGKVADTYDMSRGFIVPLLCFGFVALFAWMWPRMAGVREMRGVDTRHAH